MASKRIGVVVVAVIAALAVLWLLLPRDCVLLGAPPTSGPPCPNRLGLYLPFSVVWIVSAAVAVLVAVTGWSLVNSAQD